MSVVTDRLSTLERKRIAILAAIGFVTRGALAFRGMWQIFSRPYIDDAFYLFSCARHLAMGHGFTVDGVHATNGVQPLICLLYAPCFLPGDQWLGLRLTFIVGALMQAASTIAIAVLIAKMRKQNNASTLLASAPFFAALLWTILAPLADQNGSGLETGLVALFILCDLIYYSKIREQGWSTSHAIIFGSLLGVTVLARVDSTLFVIAFVIVEWRHLKFVLLASFVALLVSSPWWIYGYVTFGSLMPMSGAAESLGTPIGRNLQQSLSALLDMLSIFFQGFSIADWVQDMIIVGVISNIVQMLRKHKLLHATKQDYRFRPLLPLALFGILGFLYYNFFFAAPHFMARYLHPVRILILISSAALLSSVIQALKNEAKGTIILYTGILVAGLAFSVYRYVNEFTADPKSDFYPLGLWALKHEGRVGCDQSGQAGFIAPNVINLDGKVNYEALEARKQGSIGAYIAHERIEYLADWEPLVKDLVREAEKFGARYEPYDTIRYVQIYRLVN
jgi:hypothetical protein